MSVLGKNHFSAGQTNRANVMNPNEVMKTGSGVPTPWNPGDDSEIRTKPVIQHHRNFKREEVAKLRVEASGRKAQAKLNRKGYAAMRGIEQADVSDQVAYRGYQGAVAKGQVTRKAADAGKAKTLLGTMPTYAKLGYSLGEAHTEAQTRVAEVQATYAEVQNKWR
jgi:hypothetical protein